MCAAAMAMSLLVVPRADAQSQTCNGEPVTMTGTPGDDRLVGTPGRDVIAGLAGDDHIDALAGDDTLCGDGGSNTLVGGPGDDSLVADVDPTGSPAYASYEDAPGPVTVDLRLGTATGDGNDTLIEVRDVIGSSFDDSIFGDDETNRLYGGPGADRIDPRSSPRDPTYQEIVHGDAGDDSLTTGGSGATVYGDDGDDQIDAIGYGSVFGGDGNDYLARVSGPSPGYPGTFAPGPGDDIVDGSAPGEDFVFYDDAASGVRVDLAAGLATGEGNDMLIGIESVAGSEHDDKLVGSAGDNELWGRAGDDVISGGDGDDEVDGWGGRDDLSGEGGHDEVGGGLGSDRVDGGAGDDLLLGSHGNDHYFGGSGTDKGNLSGAEVDLGRGTVVSLSEPGGDDGTIEGVENLTGVNVVFIGDDEPNFLDANTGLAKGAGGNDTLAGSFGRERLVGGPGDDVIRARGGEDVVKGGSGDDTIDGWTRTDSLFGGSGNDVITGGDHNDLLVGGLGVDTLDGEAGRDECRGGETYRGCERRMP